MHKFDRRKFLKALGFSAFAMGVGIPSVSLKTDAGIKEEIMHQQTPMGIIIGICGFVRSYYSQQPISGVTVSINPMNLDGTTLPSIPVNVTSDDNGFYQAELQNGLYKITATKDNYANIEYAVCIDGENVVQDILLAHKVKKGKIEGNYKKGLKGKKLHLSEIFEYSD